MKITLQRTSPNYRQKLSTTTIMNYLTVGLLVIVAWSLVAAMLYNGSNGTDYLIKTLLIYVVSIGVALVTEVVWAYIHKTNIMEHIKGSFPLVTSIIFALTLPVGTPLYVVAIGSFLAIFLGKLVYGGFGHNIFNPALVGRVIVHLSYGAQLTTTLGTADATAGATPATMLAGTSWLGEGFSYTIPQLLIGQHGGTLGETCIVVILLVGLFLAWKRVFDARIPVAYLGTVAILAGAFALANGLNPLTYALTHLCIGGVVFGAIIMATDPVTSPTSPLGKIIFGIGLGFLTMIIRFKANYPEGVLFSILIMNMLTPLIDSFVLGRTHKNAGKKFAVIALTLAIATGCTFGVGLGIKADVEEAKRIAEEEAKKAEEEAKKKAEEEAAAFNWQVLSIKGNTYTMQTTGFTADKPMKIEVVVDGDTVKSVKVLEYAGETEYFGLDLIKGLKTDGAAGEFYNKFMTSEFAVSDIDGVDTKTGCTMTVKGIVNAIRGAIALSKMEISTSGNTATYTITADGFTAGKPMKIKVVVDKAAQKVTKLEVLEYPGETEYFGLDLIKGLKTSGAAGDFYNKFMTNEFAFEDIDGVDTATGCTLTTKGIVSAIRQAIAASK